MKPEFLVALLWAGTTMLPARERTELFIVGSNLTSNSETTLPSPSPSAALLHGTGDIEVAPSIEDLILNASKQVNALAHALPPVNHEAEARMDRLMEERYAREQRKPLVRKV